MARCWPCLLLIPALFGLSNVARASNPFLEIPKEAEAMGTRAHQYANLTNQEAFAELDRRGIAYSTVSPPPRGVRAPIRLEGPLRGVSIHGVLPAEQRARSVFEFMDARLALALDDFCELLARHDIVELVHMTIYRPAGKRPEDPDAPQTRHPGGMAIDVGALRKKNGRWLAVGPHWPASLGSKTCGIGARELKARPARELVSIVCEAADLRIFHYMLTPHFDKAHHDHLHLEIKPGVKWFLVN